MIVYIYSNHVCNINQYNESHNEAKCWLLGFEDILILPSGKPGSNLNYRRVHILYWQKYIGLFYIFEKGTLVCDYTYLYIFCCLSFSSRECLPHMEMFILPRKCCEDRPLLGTDGH